MREDGAVATGLVEEGPKVGVEDEDTELDEDEEEDEGGLPPSPRERLIPSSGVVLERKAEMGLASEEVLDAVETAAKDVVAVYITLCSAAQVSITFGEVYDGRPTDQQARRVLLPEART